SSLQFETAVKLLPALSNQALVTHVEGLLLELWRSAVRQIFEGDTWTSQLEAVAAVSLDESNKLNPLRREVLERAYAARAMSANDADLKECVGCLRALASGINLKVGGRDDASKAVRAALKSIRELVNSKLSGVPDCLVEMDMLAFAHIRALCEVTERALAI